jgi:hypothetical protein
MWVGFLRLVAASAAIAWHRLDCASQRAFFVFSSVGRSGRVCKVCTEIYVVALYLDL